METLLSSCDANHLGPAIDEMGLSSIEDVAMCEPSDLVSDLDVGSDVATKLVDKAREMTLFDKRKAAVQGSWKLVEDALAVDATKLFYHRLFQEYPESKPFFENSNMQEQSEKLYKTVQLAVQYLDEVENLIPILQELGIRHALEWKVEREHYDIIAECLLWTLHTSLGENWTEEVKDGWTWVYAVIATTMADAGDAALLKRRKQAVKDTWKLVQDALGVEATKLFYKHLFEEFPSVVPLFKNTDMEAQADKLYKTVSLAVDFLEDMDELAPKLKELGTRHALEWHTKTDHYSAVGGCLVWTLKTGLGEAWTDEVADAWTWVYAIISTIMSDAGEEALAKQEQIAATNPKKKKGRMTRIMNRMAKFRPKEQA